MAVADGPGKFLDELLLEVAVIVKARQLVAGGKVPQLGVHLEEFHVLGGDLIFQIFWMGFQFIIPVKGPKPIWEFLDFILCFDEVIGGPRFDRPMGFSLGIRRHHYDKGRRDFAAVDFTDHLANPLSSVERMVHQNCVIAILGNLIQGFVRGSTQFEMDGVVGVLAEVFFDEMDGRLFRINHEDIEWRFCVCHWRQPNYNFIYINNLNIH